MFLTVFAVVMRYVFNAPLLGIQDLSEVSLVLVVFLGMAYCGWTGGHIAVDLLSMVAPPRLLRWTDTIVLLICTALFGLISILTFEYALTSLEWGEATNLVEIPHYPFILTVAICTALYALVLLVQAVRVIGGKPAVAGQ